ncbi:hypothetical protein R50073_08190 [Maricurvus nonylphenolicus]|uniref:Fis family transcriptional regulator n=1 Tax=Maricurvus nonylphenolicus TaxID=1008307 RepID=UPI0036F2D216
MSKPKSKTEKKIDSNICRALNNVCEQTLDDTPGFQWLTHQANYTNFPASLLVTCVFDTEASLSAVDKNKLQARIQSALLKIGVKFKTVGKQVVLDSEEACERDNNGSWDDRLSFRKELAVPRNRPTH